MPRSQSNCRSAERALLRMFGTQLDGIRLLEQARAQRGMRLLTLGLWLAHELGGAPLPPSLQRIIPAARNSPARQNSGPTPFPSSRHRASWFIRVRCAVVIFHWAIRERGYETDFRHP